MTVHEHARHQIWNPMQHPWRHPAAEIAYSNQSTGGLVTNIAEALDWMFAFAYPQSRDSVATVGDLPAVGNSLGDMRFVYDAGDGRGASYRWLQAEGAATPTWQKWADIDWGAGSILEAYSQRTSADYVHRRGYDDLDGDGVPVVGLFAGQIVYGGASSGTHLTLRANSGDGLGAGTGYVQVDDNFRPAVDSAYSLGAGSYRFLNGWFDQVEAGDITLSDGSIISSSGTITFGTNNLSTDGTITSGTLALSSASITDSSGSISFDDENLVTMGMVAATYIEAIGLPSMLASGTTIGMMEIGDGSIVDPSGTIDFGMTNLTTLGMGTFDAIVATTSATIGEMNVTGHSWSVLTTDTDMNIAANGAGWVRIGSPTEVIGTFSVIGDITSSGYMLATGTVEGASLITTNGTVMAPNGDLDLSSAADITVDGNFRPILDSVVGLGEASYRFGALYLRSGVGSGIGDGTNMILTSTLMSLRDINTGVGTGYSLFYDGSKWAASLPDTEVDHGTVSGLLDDDHTQYALLAGRSGGQTLTGGTAASNNLVLESTTDASKGHVVFASSLRPGSNNALDLGSASYTLRDAYITGQLYNARIENNSSAPSASASTKGRLYFNTTDGHSYVDVGGTWKRMRVERYSIQDSTGWTGSATSVVYTVSSEITDARLSLWALYDNSGSYEEIPANITKTATQVTVTVVSPLPAGTYTLVGMG